MDKYRTIALDLLRELCEAYDNTYGKYPESEYEGECVFEFIVNELEACEPNTTPK